MKEHRINGIPQSRETLRSRGNFYPETIQNQFVKDLQKMSDLGNIKWIFSKTNGIDDIANLKGKVLKALKKADGTPVDELENLFKANPVSASEKFSTLFGKRIRNPDDIIDVLNDNSVFNKLFEIVE